jgi:hypothetical protein
VLGVLSLQLALGWLHGAMLNRQHKELVALRDDIQTLTDSLDENAYAPGQEEGPIVPTRHRHRTNRHRLQTVAFVVRQDDATQKDKEKDQATDAATKDMKEAKDSAQKAIEKAQEARSKLSIEENYRKAEEKKKLEAAENVWTKWAGIGLLIAFLALVIRAWLRRRG